MPGCASSTCARTETPESSSTCAMRRTEVIARVSSPAPGALTGALTFKALYRARALLMTGEMPTIRYNPSARDSDR
ncbi:MAG: putative integral rane protein [Mycobacterium sp.]|jgi:hypothetical protein|nr:putative integral rane protein [Mycobacterium sp.]